jgi:ADP-ribosylation factor-like protein 6
VENRNLPVFFLLNKQDKANKYDKDGLIKEMGLESKKFKNKLYFKETSGFNGQGLKETLDQITDHLLLKKV